MHKAVQKYYDKETGTSLASCGKKAGDKIFKTETGGIDWSIMNALKEHFLESNDPTEYYTAIWFAGHWHTWNTIKEASATLRRKLKEWHEELEIKLRSENIRIIASDAMSNSKSAAASAKYIAERQWAKRERAGRPSKEIIDPIEEKIDKDTKEDYLRIVKGKQVKAI